MISSFQYGTNVAPRHNANKFGYTLGLQFVLLGLVCIGNMACTPKAKPETAVSVVDTLKIDTVPPPVTEFVAVDSLRLDTLGLGLDSLPAVPTK